MNASQLRKDFPVLEKKFNGKPVVYLDNAATSLKPLPVIQAIQKYYSEESANVHRASHKMSLAATQKWLEAHEKTAKLINARKEEIIFTRNATESINLLMYSLKEKGFFSKGDEVLLTKMEHHSNLVPWQQLQKLGVKLNFVELTPDFRLDLNDLEKKLSDKTKLVSFTHVANTLGTINPVQEIVKTIKKKSDALIVLDAAQSVPHMKIDSKKLGIDFLAFSFHKMLGPTGLGVLFGRKDLLNDLPPFLFGGDMIQSVALDKSTWNELPWKFEAGTPHISAGYGAIEAINYLKKVGFDSIGATERKLVELTLNGLQALDKVKVYGTDDLNQHAGMVLFEVKGIDCHDIALSLDELNNIAVRSGFMCAEPTISSLNRDGLVRASYYFYNTREEIEAFIETLEKIIKTFS